jgi:hypothetical protein
MTTIAWDGKTLAADKCAWHWSLKFRISKLRRLNDGRIAGCAVEDAAQIADLVGCGASFNPVEA